jgi:hypothetical protein
MPIKRLLLYAALFAQVHTFAQSVSINSSGTPADNSAMLDVSSTTKGLLIPRMTMAERNQIASPATGLMIFQTDGTPGYYYNAGNPVTPVWTPLGGPSHWEKSGSGLFHNLGNVGIGVDAPESILHIRGAGLVTSLTIENTSTNPNSEESLIFSNENGKSAGINMSDAASDAPDAMRIYNLRPQGNIRLSASGFNNADLYIGKNGRVGLGNATTPEGILHVKGAEFNTNPVVFESVGSDVVGPTLRFTGPYRTYEILGSIGSLGVPVGISGSFAIYDRHSDSYRFVISQGGSVGIGTDLPSNETQLHVVSSNMASIRVVNNSSMNGYAIDAQAFPAPGIGTAVRGTGGLCGGAFEANSTGSSFPSIGVQSYATGDGLCIGVYGIAEGGGLNYAGYFMGDLYVSGRVTKGSGSFKIDHPLDPANKTLSHSFVESPDMLNVYTGNVITDGNGEAIATLPSYFEALNIDYTYQLTVIGDFAQAIVSKEIKNNCFVIKTNKPNVKVSWMVTGIRNDPYAQQYRIVVEEEKTAEQKGKYLNPEVFGQPASKSMHPHPVAEKQ